jgi:hypothetical protein
VFGHNWGTFGALFFFLNSFGQMKIFVFWDFFFSFVLGLTELGGLFWNPLFFLIYGGSIIGTFFGLFFGPFLVWAHLKVFFGTI